MNSDTYVECLVSRKPSALMKFLKILLIMLCVAFLFVGFAFGMPLAIFLVIPFGGLAYFVSLKANIEYEYLYLDREISVDRISGQSSRKRIATYEVDRMEIIAPIKSYHLDDYKNRQCKTVDYSSGIEGQPDKRYVFFYEGNTKIVFEPSEELIKAVYNVAPRKVFMD